MVAAKLLANEVCRVVPSRLFNKDIIFIFGAACQQIFQNISLILKPNRSTSSLSVDFSFYLFTCLIGMKEHGLLF